MPKTIKFPTFMDDIRPIAAPLSGDRPCPIGHLVVTEKTGRIIITSTDAFVYVLAPYQDYYIQYTVPAALYGCVGWNRTNHDLVITIWDGKHSCTFTIPAISNT